MFTLVKIICLRYEQRSNIYRIINFRQSPSSVTIDLIIIVEMKPPVFGNPYDIDNDCRYTL